MISDFEQRVIEELEDLWQKEAREMKYRWEISGQDEEQVRLVVRMDLAPPVAFAEMTGDVETVYPLLVENLGREPVTHLHLRVEPSPQYRLQDYDFEIDQLYSGQSQMLELHRTAVFESTTVTVGLTYKSPYGKGEKKLSFWVLKGDKVLPQDRLLRNPYLPDGPLASSRDWDLFGDFPSRSAILDKIMAQIQSRSEKGAWINLYGLRRTGKTSLLLQLEQKLNALPKEGTVNGDTSALIYVPVYIDLFDLDPAESWDEKRVLVVIANAILFELQEREMDFPSMGLTVSDEGLTRDDFWQFVREVYRQAGEQVRLVIMLDEADLLAESPFAEFATQLLYALQSSTYRVSPGLYFVLATERAIGELWGEFGELGQKRDGLCPLTIRLPLLSRDEVIHIAGIVDELEYSELAQEYLWRITGGYPSLVQVICYEIVNERASPGHKRSAAVTWPVVHRVVDELIRNEDTHHYFNYLQLGFTESEWNSLGELVSGGSIDPSTMRIRMEKEREFQEPFTALETKEIIVSSATREGGGIGWRKLRVGFFKLWLERVSTGAEQ